MIRQRPGLQHRLDRRRDRLAARIVEVRDQIVAMLVPPGGAHAFMDQVSSTEGLAFWKKYRYTDVGQRILAGKSADQIAELDAYLARHVEMPIQQPPQLPAGPPSL